MGFSHEKEGKLHFGTTWIELDGIMLSEISQIEKDNYCMISLICRILKSQTHRTKIEMWQPRAGGEGIVGWGNGKVWVKGPDFQLQDEYILGI